MGSAVVKFKIMPTSAEANLEEMRSEFKGLLEKEEVKGINFEEEPVAFGLMSLIITFNWPEEKPLESLQESFEKIEDVNSVQLLDIRRAIG